jgi:hypothetical protein
MRFVTLLAVVALLAASASAAPFETSTDHIQKVSSHDPRPYPPVGDVGGETFADAVDMVALPFTDSGNLWDYTDDIDFNYGTSPDVVYYYTPDFDGCVTFDLCESQYDSMIWVVDATQTTILFWNDDGIACDAFQSQIAWMPVYNGVLYYYVIDGYGGSAGPFVVNVFTRDCPPPPECPPEALIEGEGCADPYDDFFNAGCNAAGYHFSVVPCDPSVVVCGTVFNHYGTDASARRDTDWYLLPFPAGAATVSTTAYYESSGSLYYIAMNPDCTGDVYIPYGIHLGSRELGAMSELLDPALDGGTGWAVFMSKNYYDGTWYPCTDPESWPYVLTIDGLVCPTPTDVDSWGGVKSLFQ